MQAKLKKKISSLEESTKMTEDDDILIRKPGVSDISKKLQLDDDEDEQEEEKPKKRSKKEKKPEEEKVSVFSLKTK